LLSFKARQKKVTSKLQILQMQQTVVLLVLAIKNKNKKATNKQFPSNLSLEMELPVKILLTWNKGSV